MDFRVTATVDVSPSQVWRSFVDVERWPELTPSMREVRRVDSGPLRVGSEAVIKQPGLPRNRWRVTELEPDRSFTWKTKVGLVTAVGGHQVEPAGPGSTITLTLSQHGPLAGFIGALMSRRIRRNLSMELEGFRSAR